MLRLPRLPGNTPIVDDRGQPSLAFSQWWQSVVTQIEASINAIQAALDAAGLAQAAANTASAAATAAAAAATTAQGAADAAAAAAAAQARENALVNSYIVPDSVLSATPTTITIAAHTRHYADGTTAAVSGGTVGATAASDVDFISYSDPARTGGSVSYVVATTAPTQTGDTHVVGAVTIPTTGTASGGRGPQKPGFVEPD